MKKTTFIGLSLIEGFKLELWTEMRTAMTVARLGTVRAAAKELGIHRATVTRHVDAIEAKLGIKLFLRHPEGYAITADGSKLRRLAEATDRLIGRFVSDAIDTSNHLTGRINVSTFYRSVPLVTDGIRAFNEAHPDVLVQITADGGFAQLEQGHMDIAIRPGPKPDNPDYVVQPFRQSTIALFGHECYFENNPIPTTVDELSEHRFVGIQPPGLDIDACAIFGVAQNNVPVVTNDPSIALAAIEAGIGLGFVAEIDFRGRNDLVEVLPQDERTKVDTWIVTHVDVHRTRLIKSFLPYLRA